VSNMFAMLDETVAAVRRIASDLRPLMLDDLGLTAAIEWLARDTARRTGIHFSVQLAELPGPPGGRIATALYRMVQEGLTNVVRHAQARQVQVRLDLDGDAAVLTVTDDGVGLPEATAVREDAYGLLGMRERAAMLGGTLAVENCEGGGVRLTIRMPLEVKGHAGPFTAKE
jgi:two-component system sensor histidine kinase UhpB